MELLYFPFVFLLIPKILNQEYIKILQCKLFQLAQFIHLKNILRENSSSATGQAGVEANLSLIFNSYYDLVVDYRLSIIFVIENEWQLNKQLKAVRPPPPPCDKAPIAPTPRTVKKSIYLPSIPPFVGTAVVKPGFTAAPSHVIAPAFISLLIYCVLLRPPSVLSPQLVLLVPSSGGIIILGASRCTARLSLQYQNMYIVYLYLPITII